MRNSTHNDNMMMGNMKAILTALQSQLSESPFLSPDSNLIHPSFQISLNDLIFGAGKR